MAFGELFGFTPGAQVTNARRPGRSSVHDHRRISKPKTRGFDPAEGGRLFAGWKTSRLSADEEVKMRLEEERARARELERSNPWAVRYYTLYLQNVFGEHGIRLIPRVTMTRGDKVVPDVDANTRIKDGWLAWGKRGVPTVCGRHSWASASKMAGISYKRDGEAFVRSFRGGRFGPFGYQLKLYESDHVPVGLNRSDLLNGNRICMGFELDEFDKVVRYWLSETHPGAPTGLHSLDRYIGVPADEIMHIFDPRRIGQTRGLPSLESGLTSLNMLQGYEEAELVGARAGSSKMGFIESEDGDGYEGEEDSELTDAEIIEAFEPGTVGQLGKNQKFVGWDPQHPSSGFKDFVKQMLRRFSATGGASYNSVAQDLESVNFSSLRDGKLTERDFWRMEQGLQIDMLNERVYEQWLPQAIMSGELGKAFPILKLDQLSVHRWQGRRWEWVDPAKEATAHKLQLANLTTTVSDIVEGEGHDLREVFETIQHERQLALEYGVDDLLPYAAAQAPPTFGAPPPNGEE